MLLLLVGVGNALPRMTDLLVAARKAVLAMRANDDIGDDAFHRIEEELDWLDMSGGPPGATAKSAARLGLT